MVYHQEAAVYLDRCKNILLNQDSSVEEKLHVLADLHLIVSAETPNLPSVFDRIDAVKFKQEFRAQHVTPLVEWLCSVFIESNSVLLSTSPDVRESLIRLLDCCDDCLSVLLLLCSFERRNKAFPGAFYVGSKALLLQAMFERQKILAQLVVRFATSPTTMDFAFEGDIISRVASVPDVAMAILGSEGRDSFCRDDVFFTSVIKQIATALEQLTDMAKQANKDINVRFAGRLLGKLAARGYHDIIWNVLMSSSLPCSRLLETDQIFVRLFSTVVANSPVGGGLENLLVALLARAPQYEHVKRILGSMVARRPEVEHLLTKQFVFVRCFNKVQFCRNLVGYLASSHAWTHLFLKLLLRLVDTWGSRVGIRHQSYDQQLYLSRLLMCSAAHIDAHRLMMSSDSNDAEFLSKFRSKVIEGVTNHLESPIGKVSRLGMVVGETLTMVLYPADSSMQVGPAESVKLKFNYDVDDEISELKSLAIPQVYESWISPKLEETWEDDSEEQVVPGVGSSSITTDEKPKLATAIKMVPVTIISRSASTLTNGSDPSDETVNEAQASSSSGIMSAGSNVSANSLVKDFHRSFSLAEKLDSDDDELPPLAHDQSVDADSVRPPVTVRQCLEFLNSREQDYPTDYFERFMVYLRALPAVIRRSTVDLGELADELAQRLLCLECPCRMADFNPVRMDAMIALTVACPSVVAKFLTGEFYEPTYSVSHRLDILRVLSTAAEILSSPVDANTTPSKPPNKLVLLSEMTNLCHPLETPQWRQVVDKRVKEKTVYFGKRKSLNEPQRAAQNRFGLVAGEFFYPLLRRYDGTSPQLDLVNRDFMVLERLIYSLAIIYHSAADTPGHPKMTKVFLEFLLAVRNHEQPVVRRAVVFSLAYVFLDVPPVLLTTEFDHELRDFNDWLLMRCVNDSDAEISRLTDNVLARLYDALRVPD